MPEISFYVLATESLAERYLFACKLIEKAYRSGCCPYVLTDDTAQSQLIDDLLWTFRAGSFIPHEVFVGRLPIVENSVLIGSGKPPERWQHTVVNVSSQCPQGFQPLERILEILDDSEETKVWGRQRYRQYQQAGIVPVTHKM
jgi:DNA polymerase III subunit chi